MSVGDAGLGEHVGHVVRDQAVTGPLGEETEGDEDDESVAVPGCLEEFQPAVAFVFFLECESLPDFPILDLDEFVVEISSSVAFGKDVECLFVLAFCNQPTGRFGDEPVFEVLVNID